jgi:hypothetical protein
MFTVVKNSISKLQWGRCRVVGKTIALQLDGEGSNPTPVKKILEKASYI